MRKPFSSDRNDNKINNAQKFHGEADKGSQHDVANEKRRLSRKRLCKISRNFSRMVDNFFQHCQSRWSSSKKQKFIDYLGREHRTKINHENVSQPATWKKNVSAWRTLCVRERAKVSSYGILKNTVNKLFPKQVVRSLVFFSRAVRRVKHEIARDKWKVRGDVTCNCWLEKVWILLHDQQAILLTNSFIEA